MVAGNLTSDSCIKFVSIVVLASSVPSKELIVAVALPSPMALTVAAKLFATDTISITVESETDHSFSLEVFFDLFKYS